MENVYSNCKTFPEFHLTVLSKCCIIFSFIQNVRCTLTQQISKSPSYSSSSITEAMSSSILTLFNNHAMTSHVPSLKTTIGVSRTRQCVVVRNTAKASLSWRRYERFWRKEEAPAPSGIRTPDRRARNLVSISTELSWLLHRGSAKTNRFVWQSYMSVHTAWGEWLSGRVKPIFAVNNVTSRRSNVDWNGKYNNELWEIKTFPLKWVWSISR